MPICLSPKGLFFTFYCVPATIFHMTFLKCFIFNHILRERAIVSRPCQYVEKLTLRRSGSAPGMFHRKQRRKRNIVRTLSQSLLQQRTLCSYRDSQEGAHPETVKSLVCKDHMIPHTVWACWGFDLPVNSMFRWRQIIQNITFLITKYISLAAAPTFSKLEHGSTREETIHGTTRHHLDDCTQYLKPPEVLINNLHCNMGFHERTSWVASQATVL